MRIADRGVRIAQSEPCRDAESDDPRREDPRRQGESRQWIRRNRLGLRLDVVGVQQVEDVERALESRGADRKSLGETNIDEFC